MTANRRTSALWRGGFGLELSRNGWAILLAVAVLAGCGESDKRKAAREANEIQAQAISSIKNAGFVVDSQSLDSSARNKEYLAKQEEAEKQLGELVRSQADNWSAKVDLGVVLTEKGDFLSSQANELLSRIHQGVDSASQSVGYLRNAQLQVSTLTSRRASYAERLHQADGHGLGDERATLKADWAALQGKSDEQLAAGKQTLASCIKRYAQLMKDAAAKAQAAATEKKAADAQQSAAEQMPSSDAKLGKLAMAYDAQVLAAQHQEAASNLECEAAGYYDAQARADAIGSATSRPDDPAAAAGRIPAVLTIPDDPAANPDKRAAALQAIADNPAELVKKAVAGLGAIGQERAASADRVAALQKLAKDPAAVVKDVAAKVVADETSASAKRVAALQAQADNPAASATKAATLQAISAERAESARRISAIQALANDRAATPARVVDQAIKFERAVADRSVADLQAAPDRLAEVELRIVAIQDRLAAIDKEYAEYQNLVETANKTLGAAGSGAASSAQPDLKMTKANLAAGIRAHLEQVEGDSSRLLAAVDKADAAYAEAIPQLQAGANGARQAGDGQAELNARICLSQAYGNKGGLHLRLAETAGLFDQARKIASQPLVAGAAAGTGEQRNLKDLKFGPYAATRQGADEKVRLAADEHQSGVDALFQAAWVLDEIKPLAERTESTSRIEPVRAAKLLSSKVLPDRRTELAKLAGVEIPAKAGGSMTAPRFGGPAPAGVNAPAPSPAGPALQPSPPKAGPAGSTTRPAAPK